MDLSQEEFEHLDNICTGGLMRKVIPDDVSNKFLAAGYARKAVGGLMPTEEGYKIFMKGKK